MALDSVEMTCASLFDNPFIPVPPHPRNLGFWISGFRILCQWNCFFVFLAVFLFAKPRIWNSTSKNFQNGNNFIIFMVMLIGPQCLDRILRTQKNFLLKSSHRGLSNISKIQLVVYYQAISQSVNQRYLNMVNGSATWFSDMPCDNYKL